MPDMICPSCDRDEWLAARRAGVTATDIVTILGLSSRASPYSLFWQKMGLVPETPDNDRLRLGRELQPYVRDRWAQEQPGSWHFEGGSLHRHDTRSWQMATPDYRIGPGLDYREPLTAVLELKTWADAARDMWLDGPPPAVRAQVLWQMDVMDAAMGHVGVLFLPSGEFRSYVIDHTRTEGCEFGPPWIACICQPCLDLALMRAAGEEFMRRLRMELPPPDPDNSAATLAAARARFAKAKGKRGQVDAGLWDRWLEARDDRDAAECEQRECEIKLREQLGEADEIEVDGELVGRRVMSVQHVKAHDRHMDYLRRVGNGKAGDDE